MPNFVETQDIVRRYLNARVPLIVVQSIEPTRVMSLLRACAAEMRALTFFEHTRTDGLRELLTGHLVSEEVSLALALEQARTAFKTRANANFVFTDVEDLNQESSTARHFAEMVRLAETRQGTIILITSSPVWTGLSRLGMSVALDLPGKDEMQLMVRGMLDDHREVVRIEWGDPEISRASEILSGITEMEAINVLATLMAKGVVRNEDLAELSVFKDRIFGDLNGIERIHLREGFAVGGLGNLKAWLHPREQLMKQDLSGTRLHPPKGVLLVGVPGCGKSLSAKAIASQWGLPLYRLDMASVLGMYVGQSEGQLREALATAERVAPCVLWIDEIEKGLASGGGDGGTTRRLIGQFLFWMQELTAKVFMVATANDVATLPPELLRKGRFDELFFVDLPDGADRAEILTMYFHKYLSTQPDPYLLDELVAMTDGFSGSDLDAVVHDIATKMYVEYRLDLPDHAEIRQFFTNVVPYSQTNPEDLAYIRAWGTTRCIPASRRHDAPSAPQHTRRMVIV
ncbi:MAG TPA: AAA family ATPase [Arachnia sp.]|nr:AAA family ATPase [Arachnia sp.]HMT84943.1 AAA family ATPase [Arachnia sp.]